MRSNVKISSEALVYFMDDPLDLGRLRVFHGLAQTASFTETARRLHRTQSAISHTIRNLEESLGFQLVERLPRGIRLTDEGRRLYKACESAFALLHEAGEDLRLGKGGLLRLGVTVEFGTSILMRQLRPFLAEHPRLELDITLHPDLLGPLLRDDLDLIIDCREHPRSDLRRIPLFREAYTVAAAPALHERLQLRAPLDLARAPILSTDRECTWWHRFLLALAQDERPEWTLVHAMGHIRAMIHAALDGLGVLLAPRYSILRELRQGELVELFPRLPMQEDWFCLYQKQNHAGSRLQRSFTDILRSINPAEFGA